MTRYALKTVAIKFFNDQPESKRPPGSQKIPADNHDLDDNRIFSLYYGSQKVSAHDFGVARKQIASSNARVDKNSNTKADPEFHFDDEQFHGANANIKRLRENIIRTVRTSRDHEAGWQNLGEALHILQDFYSHSNWVEMGNTLPLPGIGNPNGDSFGPVKLADRSVHTCKDCDNSDPQCMQNILPEILRDNILTSGYFHKSQPAHKPEGKCSHGGIFDATSSQTPTGGIAKDGLISLSCGHPQWHLRAAAVAEEASVNFLNELRNDLGDDMFGDFLNLFIGKTLSIVMDTTGSMADYIETAKERVKIIVEKSQEDKVNPILSYILSPFNDPTVGPVFQTTDANEFIAAIEGLFADGGGDCPELSMSGILKAAELSSLGSPIFVFTDASAKDANLQGAVEAIAKDKELQITFFGYTTSCEDKMVGQTHSNVSRLAVRDTVMDGYYKLASVTGGLVFTAGDESLFNTTVFMEEALQDLAVNILQLFGSQGNLSESFFVDDGITKLTVSFISPKGYLPDFSLISPSGKVVHCQIITSANTVRTCEYTELIVGTWQLKIQQTEDVSWTCRITGISPLEADFELYKQPSDSREFLQQLDSNPIAGSDIFVEYSVSDSVASLSTALIFNGTDGQLLCAAPLEYQGQSSKIYFGNFSAPSKPFYIGVIGLDADANHFQRVNLATISPTLISLEVVSLINSSLTLVPGGSLNVSFNVTNQGQSAMFTFLAYDSLGFIQSFYPESLYVSNGEIVEVFVTLSAPSSATAGISSRVTMTAKVDGGSTEANFLQILVAVISSYQDTTPPSCQISKNTIGSRCSREIVADPERCKQNIWFAEFNFEDSDSGLGNLVVSAIGGQVEWNLPNIYNGSITENLKANATGDCCVAEANLHVVDMAGLSQDCRIENPFQPTSPTTPASTADTTPASTAVTTPVSTADTTLASTADTTPAITSTATPTVTTPTLKTTTSGVIQLKWSVSWSALLLCLLQFF